MLFCEFLLSPEVSKKLTTSNIRHKEIQVPSILCESFQSDQERMVNVGKNIILADNVINLAQLNDVRLL